MNGGNPQRRVLASQNQVLILDGVNNKRVGSQAEVSELILAQLNPGDLNVGQRQQMSVGVKGS